MKNSKTIFKLLGILFLTLCMTMPTNRIIATQAAEGDFVIKDGVLTKYKGKSKDVVVPDGVHTIGRSTFWKKDIVSITLSEGLRVIEDYAFEGKNFTTVLLLESVEKIGNNAFASCKSLQSINMDNVREIGRMAFWNDGKLIKIGELSSLETIGATAFGVTPWLDAERGKAPLVICNGILIDGMACKGFVTLPKTVKSIAPGAFGSGKLTGIKISGTVTEIGEGAFSGCYSLKSVYMPDSVKKIGDFAFEDCKKLNGVRLSNKLKQIPEGCFRNCRKLADITIPESVTDIHMHAFNYCAGLRRITISPKMSRNVCSELLEQWETKNVTVYTDANALNADTKKYLDGKKKRADTAEGKE